MTTPGFPLCAYVEMPLVSQYLRIQVLEKSIGRNDSLFKYKDSLDNPS